MSSTILNELVTSGLKIRQDIGESGLKGVVIGNSSNLQATVVLQGASISRTLYPYTVDFFLVPHDASQNPLPWSGNLLIEFAAGSPDTGAYVQVDTIGASESFRNTYPISLSRGNVNTSVASTNAITNTTNPSGTSIITATPLGDASNAVTLTNNAQMTLGDASNAALLAITGAITATDTLNGVFVDDNSGGSYARIGHDNTHGGNILDAVSGATYVKSPDSGGKLLFQAPNGSTKWSLRAMSTFTGTGTGTYNHGLGETPDIVIVMTHVAGSQTVGYDSENATQVHVTCGAGLAFVGLAIKF